MPRLTTLLFFFITLTVGIAPALSAQDLSNLKEAKWAVNGGLSAGLSTYGISGDLPQRTAPFAYHLAGNVNLSYGGLSIPFSVTYRDREGSISNPFSYFGISPTYKWATAHLGYRSIPLGKFVFSGQTFLGAGVELMPGKFRFSAFRGNLRTPLISRTDVVLGDELLEDYERRATGIRIGLGTETNHFDLVAARVRDVGEGGDAGAARIEGYPPADNLALSTQFRFRIAKSVSLRGETSLSAITNDRERDSLDVDQRVVQVIDGLIDINETSRAHFAHDYDIAYNNKTFRLGVEYQRVDPFYRSLGTPYVANDIERINLRLGFALAKGNVRLDGRLGRQRNNLNELLQTANVRWVGSLNANARMGKNVSVQARYYNFQSELQDGLLVVDDTLRRGQQTATYAITPAWRKRTQSGTLSLRLSSTWRALEYVVPGQDRRNSDQLSLNLGAGRDWTANKLSLRFNLRYQLNDGPSEERGNYGGGLNLDKGWLEQKLRTGIGANYQIRTRGGVDDGSVVNLQFTTRLKLGKQNSFGLRGGLLRSSSPVAERTFNELRVHANYRFTF